MAIRSELLDAVGVRYRAAVRAERSRILDEFAAVTGYHRKHAIRLLAGGGKREVPGADGVPALILLGFRGSPALCVEAGALSGTYNLLRSISEFAPAGFGEPVTYGHVGRCCFPLLDQTLSK